MNDMCSTSPDWVGIFQASRSLHCATGPSFWWSAVACIAASAVVALCLKAVEKRFVAHEFSPCPGVLEGTFIPVQPLTLVPPGGTYLWALSFTADVVIDVVNSFTLALKGDVVSAVLNIFFVGQTMYHQLRELGWSNFLNQFRTKVRSKALTGGLSKWLWSVETYEMEVEKVGTGLVATYGLVSLHEAPTASEDFFAVIGLLSSVKGLAEYFFLTHCDFYIARDGSKCAISLQFSKWRVYAVKIFCLAQAACLASLVVLARVTHPLLVMIVFLLPAFAKSLTVWRSLLYRQHETKDKPVRTIFRKTLVAYTKPVKLLSCGDGRDASLFGLGSQWAVQHEYMATCFVYVIGVALCFAPLPTIWGRSMGKDVLVSVFWAPARGFLVGSISWEEVPASLISTAVLAVAIFGAAGTLLGALVVLSCCRGRITSARSTEDFELQRVSNVMEEALNTWGKGEIDRISVACGQNAVNMDAVASPPAGSDGLGMGTEYLVVSTDEP